jgi:hypothetical protein
MLSDSQKYVSRRNFIGIIPVLGFGVLTACTQKTETTPMPPPTAVTPPPETAPIAPVAQPAAVLPMLDEKDVQAVAFGYVENSAKADKSKFPMSVATSNCSNCALYSGGAGEAAGPCAIFAGKRVMAAGWCNSWAKKA